MAHCDAVADGDSIELERDAPCSANGVLDGLGDLIEVDVARDYLAKAVGDADERLADIFSSESTSVKQPPVRGTLKAFLNRITSHDSDSPKTLAKSFEKLKIVFYRLAKAD